MGRGRGSPDRGSRPLVCQDRLGHGTDAYHGSIGKRLHADRPKHFEFRDRRNLEIVVDHDPRLFNQYAAMLVNPARHPKVKADLGMALIEWLTSPQGQDMIASYKVAGEQLFFPDYVRP